MIWSRPGSTGKAVWAVGVSMKCQLGAAPTVHSLSQPFKVGGGGGDKEKDSQSAGLNRKKLYALC